MIQKLSCFGHLCCDNTTQFRADDHVDFLLTLPSYSSGHPMKWTARQTRLLRGTPLAKIINKRAAYSRRVYKTSIAPLFQEAFYCGEHLAGRAKDKPAPAVDFKLFAWALGNTLSRTSQNQNRSRRQVLFSRHLIFKTLFKTYYQDVDFTYLLILRLDTTS